MLRFSCALVALVALACSGNDFQSDTSSSASGGTSSGGGNSGNAGSGEQGWCAGQDAIFCADFDQYSRINDLLDDWSTYSTVGGEFSFDTSGDVPSKPNALVVKTTTEKNAQTLVVATLEPFAKPPSKLLVEFTLQVDAAADVGFLSGAVFAGIMNGESVDDGVIALGIGNGPALSVSFVEPADAGGMFGAANAQGAFPDLGKWLGRYALMIEYQEGSDGVRTGCAQLLVGGLPQLADCLPLPASLSDPARISLSLGVYSAGFGVTGDVLLRFDNLVVTAE